MPSAQNLPTKELTWEYDLVREQRIFSTNEESANREVWLFMSYMFTGALRKAYGGTFSDQGGGTVRFTPTQISGPPPVFDPQFRSDVDGKKVEFKGSNSAGNDGTFTITDYDAVDGLWIEFQNLGTPVFEADATVSVRVDNGLFTVPLTVKGSSAGSTGKGAAMDGRDRWLTASDLQSSTSDVGNKSWIVWQTASGGEFLVIHRTNSSTLDWIRSELYVSPEMGFTGGSATVKPTATDQVLHVGNTTEWLGDSSVQNDTSYHNLWIDSTGQNFMWVHVSNNLASTAWFSLVAVDTSEDAQIPWTGSHNVMACDRGIDSTILTFAQYNDNPQLSATIDQGGVNGGPFSAAVYITCEMITNAMNGEHFDFEPDELTSPREYIFWPMGLASLTTGIRGRYGRIRDLFWGNSNTFTGDIQGGTFPQDNSKQWIKIGNMIYPWDGVTQWRRT